MKTIKIKELGIEVEKKYHFKNIRIKDIVIPKGWRLLTLPEFLVCLNKHSARFEDLNFKTDEIIQNPFDKNIEKYPMWNVWLRGLGYESLLLGDLRVLGYDDSVRGVRFCRDLKKVKR